MIVYFFHICYNQEIKGDFFMDNEVIKQSNNNNSNDNNMAMVSMILGIISVVLCWVPIIGLALGIVSLTLAVKGFKVSKQVNKGRGFSIAGISCGSVGIVLNIFYTIIWIIYGIFLKYAIDEMNNETTRQNVTINRSYDYDSERINSILDYYNYDI